MMNITELSKVIKIEVGKKGNNIMPYYIARIHHRQNENEPYNKDTIILQFLHSNIKTVQNKIIEVLQRIGITKENTQQIIHACIAISVDAT